MTKIRVSRAALLRRINRALDKEGKNRRVHVCPSAHFAHRVVGSFYLTDGAEITDTKIDLVKLARKLGVWKAWELFDPEEDR